MIGERIWHGRRLRRRCTFGLVIALLGALALSTGAIAQAVRSAEDVREYEVPASPPEGVVYDQKTQAFYGGSVSDGLIYKGTLDDPTAEVFLPAGSDGRNEAIGVNVDNEVRLYIAGGSSGTLYVYDIETKELIARFETGEGGFINDVAISKNGDVYFTDSIRPFIYRVSEDQVEDGGGTPEAIPLTPEVDYEGFPNANGIRITPNGKYIIFADSNDGKLYRMVPAEDPTDREISEIGGVRGQTDNPDGLELRGHTLYVVNNQDELIIEVRLSGDYLGGRVVGNTTTLEFHTPTTASLARGRLLVANAEFFDQSEPGPPFYVVSIPRP
jgi:outer membrane protein assembly factor BamB